VLKARDLSAPNDAGACVALKRIKMENEQEGV
jgi:hypothetical protein